MALDATMDTVYQEDFIHFSLFLPCYFKLLQLVRCLLYDSAALHIIYSYSYKYSQHPKHKTKNTTSNKHFLNINFEPLFSHHRHLFNSAAVDYGKTIYI